MQKSYEGEKTIPGVSAQWQYQSSQHAIVNLVDNRGVREKNGKKLCDGCIYYIYSSDILPILNG